jgi:hypothetical protein
MKYDYAKHDDYIQAILKNYKITNHESENCNDSFDHLFGTEKFESYISGTFDIEVDNLYDGFLEDVNSGLYCDEYNKIIDDTIGSNAKWEYDDLPTELKVDKVIMYIRYTDSL